jgi:hypothetical protein
VLGQGAGFVNDVVGEGMKAGYRALVPDKAQEAISSGIKSYMAESPNLTGAIQGASDIYGAAQKANPEGMRMLEAGANIAGALPVVQGLKRPVMEGVNIAKDVLSKTPEAINKAIDGVVKSNLGKSIRIAPQGKPTWSAVEGYFDKSGGAVQDIIKNKENLQLTNIVGDAVKNQLPETRIQMAQAIQDTKSLLFNEFNAKQVAGGKKGAVIDLEPIAKELDAVIKNKTLLADADGRVIIEHAIQQQAFLREAGSFTPQQAQEWITRANSKLSPAYAKGTYQDISKAGVDESMASMMRKNLDNALDQVGEKGYQELKNRYGALTQLEKGANKASVASLSKANMPNFFDITSGTALVHGLLSMNPATITAAGFMEALNVARRHFQNPDTYVKAMFSKTEKLMQQRGVGLKSKTMQNVTQGLGEGGATPTTPFVQYPTGTDRNAPKSAFSPAAKVDRNAPLALPPGQGFDFYAVPASSKFSPELAKELQKLKQLALPEGQGFELVSKSRLTDYYDTISEQVGNLKNATSAEKMEIRRRIRIDRAKALEKAQTEQMYEAYR